VSFDPELFLDVTDALGIDSPAIVEKDAYAVELLRLLTQVQSEHFELVFAGGPAGTCLHYRRPAAYSARPATAQQTGQGRQ